MMLFPQGTRKMVDKLTFKDGVFRVVIENESLIVPISVCVPCNAWNSWYPLNKAVNEIRRFWGMKKINNGNVRADDDDDDDDDEIGNKIVVTVQEPIDIGRRKSFGILITSS